MTSPVDNQKFRDLYEEVSDGLDRAFGLAAVLDHLISEDALHRIPDDLTRALFAVSAALTASLRETVKLHGAAGTEGRA